MTALFHTILSSSPPKARSLGSVALRKAENMEGGVHFNVFTVDFNEELVALYGGSLLRQTHFLHESIKAILRLYKVRLQIPSGQTGLVTPGDGQCWWTTVSVVTHSKEASESVHARIRITCCLSCLEGTLPAVQTVWMDNRVTMCWLTVCFSACQHLKTPPQSVVLVGHSMGGVVARALYTLPRFNPSLVSIIITHASPHLAPVLALDPYLLGKENSHAGLGHNIWTQRILISPLSPLLGVDFYSSVQQRWVNQANKLRNVTVLSVGGGYRDYQVRSGLISLPCPPGDPNKLSLVVSVVCRLVCM